MSTERPKESELRIFKVFEGLEDGDLEPLCERSRYVQVSDGDVLLEEGEPTESIFLIHEGAIAFYRETGAGDQLLSHLGERSFFGELGLFGLDKAVTVRAVGDSTLIQITYELLEVFFETHPSIRKRFEMSATNMAVALELGRRQEVRIRIQQDIALQMDDGSEVEVRLENLSPGGVCLTWVPAHWMVGERVRFALKLPQGLLHISGKVVWRYKKRVGIALERTLPNHSQVIQRAIRAFLEASPDPLMGSAIYRQ